MTDFEQQVREMLHRRAADVVETSIADLPDSARRNPAATERERSPRVLVAAAALLVAFGLGAFFVVDNRSSQEIDLAVDTSTTTNALEPSTTLPPTPSSSVPSPNSEGEASTEGWNLEAVRRLLPDDVDLASGPLVFEATFGLDTLAIGDEYLNTRLGILTGRVVEEIDVDGELSLLAWWRDDVFGGVLVVRASEFQSGVVAAFGDELSLTGLQRTLEGLTGEVVGQPVGVIEIVLSDAAGAEILSSASSTAFAPIDVELPPFPVSVLALQTSGGLATVSEVVIDSIGFPEVCGAEPPVSFGVGEAFSSLVEAAPDGNRILINQRLWTQSSDEARIDLRWPASPQLGGILRAFPDLERPRSTGMLVASDVTLEPFGDTTLTEVVLVLADDFDNPCNYVQFDIYAQKELGDGWGGALSGQWSFGAALDIAAWDPPSDLEATEPFELVIGTASADARPVVAVGSCDGLPDDPPRTGAGTTVGSPTAAQALEAFLEQLTLDGPPLPAAGYLEVSTGEGLVSYVIGDEKPIVVINVVSTSDGWQVETWEASPC